MSNTYVDLCLLGHVIPALKHTALSLTFNELSVITASFWTLPIQGSGISLYGPQSAREQWRDHD